MQVETKLPVAEIFGPSIQGEGSLSGYSTIFIRMAGCNLKCFFCDTNHSVTRRLTPNEILNVVIGLGDPDKHIITITGGEPLMYKLNSLIEKLFAKGYRITIETNGTINRPKIYKYLWNLTVSPKLPKNECSVDWKAVDTIKCLWPSIINPDEFTGLSHRIEKFIQPNSCKYGAATDKVKELGFPWRLGIQIHKVIGEM